MVLMKPITISLRSAPRMFRRPGTDHVSGDLRQERTPPTVPSQDLKNSTAYAQLVACHQEGALGHRKYCRRRRSLTVFEHLWTGGNNPLMALREIAFLGEFRPVFRKL